MLNVGWHFYFVKIFWAKLFLINILKGGFINLISIDPEGTFQVSEMYDFKVFFTFNGKISEVIMGLGKKVLKTPQNGP